MKFKYANTYNVWVKKTETNHSTDTYCDLSRVFWLRRYNSMYVAGYKLEKWEKWPMILSMIQHFTTHTINCVCHSIRSMFKALGIYSFDSFLIHENSIYGGSAWNVVIFRYSVAKGMIYRGKVLTCIKKHHKMVEICHVTEYVCTSWPRNWINIMRQKPWDNFSILVRLSMAKQLSWAKDKK